MWLSLNDLSSSSNKMNLILELFQLSLMLTTTALVICQFVPNLNSNTANEKHQKPVQHQPPSPLPSTLSQPPASHSNSNAKGPKSLFPCSRTHSKFVREYFARVSILFWNTIIRHIKLNLYLTFIFKRSYCRSIKSTKYLCRTNVRSRRSTMSIITKKTIKADLIPTNGSATFAASSSRPNHI